MKFQKTQPKTLVENFDVEQLDQLIDFEENKNLSEEDLKDWELNKLLGDLL